MKSKKIKVTILPDGTGNFVMDIPLINPNKEKYSIFDDWKKAYGYK